MAVQHTVVDLFDFEMLTHKHNPQNSDPDNITAENGDKIYKIYEF